MSQKMKEVPFLERKLWFNLTHVGVNRKMKLGILRSFVTHPHHFKPFFIAALKSSYFERVNQKKASLAVLEREDCVGPETTIKVSNCFSEFANVNSDELLCIAGLVAKRNPRRLLEVGTLDGNTTLQMALNSQEDAEIHTLDLPPDAEGYLGYDSSKRRYEGTPSEKKVIQHLGDSMKVDFAGFAGGKKFDFIFIDANHDYEFVKNDTLKALEVLEEGGCILWHDYAPLFSGVFSWLNELSEKLPIKRIEGTTLGYYEKG